MSVEKMQLIHIFGSMKRFSRAADIIYDAGAFHPENTKEFLGKFDTIVPFESRNPYDRALSVALEALSLAGISAKKIDFSNETMNTEDIEIYFEEARDKLSEFIRIKGECVSGISKCEYAISFLEPLCDLDVPFSKLISFEYIAVRLGKMPISSNEKYKLFILQNEEVFFFPFREDKDYVYGMYIAPKSSIEKADAIFNSLAFEQMPTSKQLEGTPKESIEMLKRDIEKMRADIEKADADIKDYAQLNQEKMLRLYSKIRHDFEVYKLMCHAAHSESTFYLVGWVPVREEKVLISALEKEPNLMCNLITDKDEEIECPDIDPPTKLKNFALFRPFESFLRMYALPAYNEMDPTPLIAIAYSILFGIMFGDVGQGAVILIGGIFFGFKKKIALGKILTCCGVFSIIFGYIYGSVFGYEGTILPGLFHPMKHINFLLLASVVFGMIMIVFMIILNLINGVRQKDFQKVVFSSNGIAGLMLYIGIIAIIALLFDFTPFGETLANFGSNLSFTWFIVVFLVLPLILIWLREPLTHICLRKKWKPENKGMYFVENFFELIDVLLSALTNTLSFIRVGAFALNHAGMMLVVFILAGTTTSSAPGQGNLAALIIGNIIIIVLEGLIVGIQVLRLNYYEFFSRFYEGGGREFEPVSINYNKNTL